MLTYYCPITGQNIRLNQFTDAPAQKLFAIHPLLQVPPSALIKIPLPKNAEELTILISAYAWQIRQMNLNDPIFRFDGKVKLSQTFLFQNAAEVIKTLYRIYQNRNNGQYHLPNFVWNGEAQDFNFWNWLKEVENIFNSYETLESNSANWELEQATESIVLKIHRTRNRLKLIKASFANLDNIRLELITKILMRPSKYEYRTLRDVKILAQEYLLESPAENWIEKEKIIRELDEIMVQKITVAEILFNDADEVAQECRDDILINYKIEICGQVFYSSTIETLKSTIPQEKLKPITLPEEQPKPENYKNRFAYEIAMRLWRQK